MKSTHAEIKYLQTYGPPKSRALVVASPYKKRIRNSRPCSNCIKIMQCIYGDYLDYIIWSSNDKKNPWRIEKLSEMELCQKSRGDRY